MTLWHGRFSSSMAASLWQLSESFPFDHLLYRQDLAGSRAHVRGLVEASLLSAAEAEQILAALDAVEEEFAGGTFERGSSDEDIHMAIERRVTEIAGSVGAKLHTGRSRNDQVATTVKLFVRDATVDIADGALCLGEALMELGQRDPSRYLPGYTHLQRAQPVLLAHHLAAHAWALTRDVDRLLETRRRMNVSPLGAGALAGTSLPLDPGYTAQLLGFDRSFANSMDAVSDRDYVADLLFDIAMLGVHVSRMGEELVLWTSSEFGFATLGDDFTTGSSMLPHKKNSDVAELARGKSGRLIGNLTTMLVVLKGLPLAYNRDLQEDKEPLIDSVTQITRVLEALRGAYGSLEFHDAVARAAADDPYMAAIDLAERLVEQGRPFREAHELVGRAVGESVRSGRPFREVVAETTELAGLLAVFEPEATLRSRSSRGAAGPVAWPYQQETWQVVHATLRDRIAAARAGETA
ncbi:MAG: argininosuccinate lyase [Acidimicrobiales bacterium]